ncbi:MAG TPA: hypothetical protein VF220_05420 [Nitrososphaeraceae archaeon]
MKSIPISKIDALIASLEPDWSRVKIDDEERHLNKGTKEIIIHMLEDLLKPTEDKKTRN